jgi:hypothetical protein
MRYTGEFIKIGNKEVKQVNKTTAKKLYDSGKTIYLNAANMRLNNCWTSPMPLDNSAGEKFKTMINEYEYYNCCNERGTYANFFTEL